MPIPLNQVPQDIREHFGSEATFEVLHNIQERVGVGSPRALARLMYRLETRDVPANDFIETLHRELRVSPDAAKTIAKEIKEKVLELKRPPLSSWGIDMDAIHTDGAKSLDEFFGLSQVTGGTISLEAIGEEKPTTVKVGVEPAKKGELFDITRGEPLIIHQEETPTEERKRPFKSLEFPFGFFGKEGEAAPSEPVKVRVEVPKEKRVVHYSELRTPLAPFQKQEEIINLETFGRKPPEVKAPIPAAPIKVEATKPQPKIEGNIVDLSE